MTISDILRYTLNSLFDLHNGPSKKVYQLNLIFIPVIFALSIAAMSIIFFFTAEFFGNPPDDLFEFGILGNYEYMNAVSEVGGAFFILFSAFYIPFIIHEEKTGFDGKTYSLANIFNKASQEFLGTFTVFFCLLLLINSVFFHDVFDLRSPESVDSMAFHQWVNSFVDLLKVYLAYFFLILLSLVATGEKFNAFTITKYKKAILASLILGFVIENLTYAIIYLVNYYIVSLILIPFEFPALAYVVITLVSLGLIAGFYLAIVSCFYFPFKYVKENSQH